MKKYIRENYKQIIAKFLIIILVLAVDLVTKVIFANLFTERFKNGNFDHIIVIKDLLSFTYAENEGAAFSIFSGHVTFLIIFSIIFIGLFVTIDFVFKEKSLWFVGGTALIIGGAIGNLIDRVFLGYVRDFISFDILQNFPICNVADCCITIGCICIFVYLILQWVSDAKKKKLTLLNKPTKEDQNDN